MIPSKVFIEPNTLSSVTNNSKSPWKTLPPPNAGLPSNERLFKHDAGILPGYLCDMQRDGVSASPLDKFIRFSFGPLEASSFDNDMKILSECI